MKTSWSVKPLSNVCLFVSGLWKGEKPPFVKVGVIRNTNFAAHGGLDYSDVAYLDVEAGKFASRRLHPGDLILEKSGGGPKQPVGRVALFEREDGDFSFSNFTSVIRVRDRSTLDPRFLRWFLHWKYLSGATQEMQSHSIGIRNLDSAAYKAIEIGIPSVDEQQYISAVLDDAFEGITTARANAGRNLRNARALFESRLHALFTDQGPGWSERRLVDVCTLLNGRAYSKPELLRTGKYPVLRVGNFFTNNEWYYSDLELDETKYCDTGDLLYAWSASFGPRIWDGGKVIYHYHIWKVLPRPDVVRQRLLFYLLAWDVDQIKAAHGTGTTMMHVSKGSMESRVVPIPPLSAQDQIASQLDALQAEVDRIERLYERKLAALDELKRSLLHHAFTGQLTERTAAALGA